MPGLFCIGRSAWAYQKELDMLFFKLMKRRARQVS
jgi:hypothetical protein